ncbi:MAG: helix-turn-helix domain-containing protein [Nitrospinota bacterium]
MSKRLEEFLGQSVVDLMRQYGVNIKDNLRFQSVAVRLREAREERGMSLKAAAAALRVPQYRLRDIEEGRVKQISGHILQAYVEFHGLKRWFARWRRANSKLATRLHLEDRGNLRSNTAQQRTRRLRAER